MLERLAPVAAMLEVRPALLAGWLLEDTAELLLDPCSGGLTEYARILDYKDDAKRERVTSRTEAWRRDTNVAAGEGVAV